jgi:cytochrome c5
MELDLPGARDLSKTEQPRALSLYQEACEDGPLTILVIAGHRVRVSSRSPKPLQLRRLDRPYGRDTLQSGRPKLRTSALRDPDQQFFASFMLVLGMLVGVAARQVALADSDELAAIPTAPISTPEAVAAPLTGPQVYHAVCIACHAAPGVGGAPALGDGDAWAARIAQGMDTLIDHALHGFSSSTGIMPRKGGRVDLSDEEIIGAVEYMVGQVAQ